MRLRGTLASIVVGMAALVLPARASAQSPALGDYRIEAFADVGFGTFENGVRKGRSNKDFGGGVAWRGGPKRRWGAELRTARLTYHKTSTDARDYEHLDAWLVGGNALVHFRDGAPVQPYLLAGLGVINASASKLCTTCVYKIERSADGSRIYVDTGEAEKGSDAVFQAGGGVKAALSRNISLRGEMLFVRAFNASYDAQFVDGRSNSNKGPWGWMRFTIGVGVHF